MKTRPKIEDSVALEQYCDRIEAENKELMKSEDELCKKLEKEQEDHVKTHDHYEQQIKELKEAALDYFYRMGGNPDHPTIIRLEQALK